MTDQEGWQLIQTIGWGTKTTDYDAIAKEMFSNLGTEKANQLSVFVSDRVNELGVAVDNYERENNISLEVGSDDGFSDLRYHIVGMGQKEFVKCMGNPLKMQERYKKNQYKESFAYAFLAPTPPPSKEENEATFENLTTNISTVYEELESIQYRLNVICKKMLAIDTLLGKIKKEKESY